MHDEENKIRERLYAFNWKILIELGCILDNQSLNPASSIPISPDILA